MPYMRDAARAVGPTIEVPIPESLRLASRLDLDTAIQIAWTIVCRAYGGDDEVQFGYQCLLSQDFVRNAKTSLEEVFIPEIRTVVLGDDVLIDSLNIQRAPLEAEASHDNRLSNGNLSMFQVWGLREDLKSNLDFYARSILKSMYSISPINVVLLVTQHDVQMHLRFEPSTELASISHHLADAFGQVLIEITANKSSSVGHLNLVNDEAEKQIYHWSRSDIVVERPDQCLFEIIDKQPPSTQAIDSWDGQLTYGQLADLSSLLAVELIGSGSVSNGDYIPICFEKSVWAIVAMLAIHKAGAAFVPIDPSCPIDRFSDIMSNVRAKLVFTSPVGMETSSVKSLAKSLAVKTMVIERNTFSRLEAVNHPHSSLSKASLMSPAYCIFTSGSTGKPKGVVIEHQALSTSLRAHGPALGLNSNSRTLQNTSYTFDVSITEIFATLVYGGCLCIPSDREKMLDTVAYMNRTRVNWAFFTPSFAQILDPHAVSTLETLVLGGEPPNMLCIKQWKTPQRRLINAYGPTECTIFSMTGDIELDQKPITSIGRPVGGMSFIADPVNPARLMPIGAPGELLIAGAILARGYLGDSEKTAASFIDPPSWFQRLGLTKITKLYKTGDMVRYCHDGTVEYLGRKDRQVKVNGQRLELGEIERTISAGHPSVTVVVDSIKQRNQPNRSTLVAFIAFDTISERDEVRVLEEEKYRAITDDIRSSLLAVLPRYMVPSHYVPLSHIPLSAAGKTDFGRLQSLERAALHKDRVNSAAEERPLTETEDIIRRAWSSALRVPCNELKLGDSFLSYGDSLAAIGLIKKLRSDNLKLRMTDIFECLTISNMAKRVEHLTAGPGKESWKPFSLIPNGICSDLVKEAAEQCHVNEDAVTDIYPCTPMQEALMAAATHHPNAYLGRYVYRLPKKVDLYNFQESWRLVMHAHTILRTRITALSKTLMQVVLDVEPEWSLHTNLKEYLEQGSLRPVIPGNALTYFALVQETNLPESTFFVWTIHHALYDGQSLPLILEDVWRAYHSMPQINRLPFRDYVGELSTISLEQGEVFWRQNLQGFTTQTFPRKHSQEYCPTADSKTSFQSDYINSSTQHSQSAQLQAAWAFLLSRYMESNDIVFGVTLNGRSGAIPGSEDIVGPTLNTLPLRINIDRQQTILEFMHEVQSCISQVMEVETIGLQQIRKLSPSAAWACDFQSIFVVQPAISPGSESLFEEDSLVLSDEVIVGRALTVEVQLTEKGRVNVHAHFDSSILSTNQVDRILQQWDSILRQLKKGDLNRPLGSISELSAQDRLQATIWNSNALERREDTIHELINRWAVECPMQDALCGWDACLTYSELSMLTDNLARSFRTLGISDGDMIPLCFEKSSYTIICMISLLKLGAAFVPLDVRHPCERLTGIVAQTRARFVLTSIQYRHLWAEREHVVIEKELFHNISSATAETLLPPVSPGNVAYVIFTSGSSGQPKGVMIQHQAICTSLRSSANTLRLHGSVRALQFASYSFDASILEIFGTLLAGGTVCTPSQEECLDSLQQTICKYEPTWAILTPSVVQILNPKEVESLKTLVLGGESITKAAIEDWKDHVHLVNAYGPTECSILCAANHVTGLKDTGVIGHPLGSAHWLVDPTDHTKLVPLGTVGELLVEGPIVAKGYLNDPGRTAAAFISHPSWRKSIDMVPQSSYMYKTGDLVRWTDKGTLSYTGRKDQQVKVRGQRLELEDIESKILHDGLDRKVLIQPTKGPFAKSLVALFTMSKRPSPEKSKTEEITLDICEEAMKIMTHLRALLSKRLPDYMLPDKWIPVTRMPLSSAAKTNRKKLVQYVEMLSETMQDQIYNFNEESHLQPEEASLSLAPVEETLRAIWSELLNVPVSRIHGRTSFLLIGGDSVSAMQLVSQCRSHELSLSVQDILQFKTLSKIAQRARPVMQTTQERQVVVTSQPFPLSPIQQMFLDTLTTEHIPAFSQSFSLQINRDIEPGKLDSAIKTIVSRNHMLQARFSRNSEGKWFQYISGDINSSYSVQLNEYAIGRKVIPALTKACRERLNPRKGPVIACEVFKCADKHYLFLAAHHLIIDLVSWRIILEDLELLLESKNLPPTFSLSFPEWCIQQDKWFSGNFYPDRVHSIQLPVPRYDYWGMAGKTNTYGMAKIHTASICPASTSKIMTLCAKNGRLELQDILIVALAIAFKRVFSDRELPPIFLEHHGREPWLPEIDITQTIGWFTTLLPVFGLVLGDVNSPDVADILRRARDCRRQVPANGWEFFSSTFLHPQGRVSRELLKPEIMLNFEGFFQQLERAEGMFEIAQIDGELADMSLDTPRLALIEFAVQVHNGQISLSCIYNQDMLYADRVEQCVGDFAQFLSDLPDLLPETTHIYSLSDFPRVSLSYQDLDNLMELATRNGIEDIYPILPVQSLMLKEQASHSFLYSPRLAFKVKSHARSICHADVSRAWRQVVKRHSVLRTIFVNDKNGHAKFQVVFTELEPKILHSERNEEVARICPRPFEWPQNKAPHQLTMYRNDGEDIMLLLEITHALVDVATITILLEDLVKGIEVRLMENPSPGVGYGDLIDQVFAQSALDSSTKFWRDTFTKSPDTILSPGFLTSRQYGELHTCVVPIGETVVSLRGALHRREISLPSVFRLAWARVIQCHLRIVDVTFGFVLSGRDIDIPHVHEMTGPLLNFTPCRVNLSQSIEDTSGAESLLKQLDSDYIQSLAHQSHASTLSTPSFDTIINFRKHKIDHSSIGNHENVWLEMLESVDPYHHSVVLEVDDWDTQIHVKLTFWEGLVNSDLAAKYASALTDQIMSLSNLIR